jgi:hypothetical protein
MAKYLLTLLVMLILIPSAYAFEDDYVWQDRFKKEMAKAEQGDADAQYEVAEMYEKGRGVHKNPQEAFDWYSKSADTGNLKAQYKLGYMYFKGLGVKHNSKKAFNLLEKPADDGNVRAQYYLAALYANGDGVEQDLEEAVSWYSRSSLGGYRPATEELEQVKKKLAQLEQREKERMARARAKRLAQKQKSRHQSKADKHKEEKNNNSEKSKLVGMLVNGDWTKRKKPVEYLPSSITECRKTSSSVVECLSGEMQRNIGVADIVYKTKTILYGIKNDGKFKIAYRNNVLKVNKKGGNSAEIKTGWQDTEHRLECNLDDPKKITCLKDKTRKVSFNTE